MNGLSEKYGLDVVVWPRNTFVAKIIEQYLFYKMNA